MFRVEEYMAELIASMQKKFGDRLKYVGLQGSYLRGEATESSDLDIMVVIDGLSVQDLRDYRRMILKMQDYDKSCGFICGTEDLKNWNPMEIAQLVAYTKDYYGVLEALAPAYTRKDIENYIRMSVNNLYHEVCHRYIHASAEKNRSKLPGTYKGVFFILQNIYYLQRGEFIATRQDMLEKTVGLDRDVMSMAMTLAVQEDYDFDAAFELLFTWCQETLKG